MWGKRLVPAEAICQPGLTDGVRSRIPPTKLETFTDDPSPVGFVHAADERQTSREF